MTLRMIEFDYTESGAITPLRPSRDFGKFFNNAEAAAWKILNAYGIKRKRGQFFPDETKVSRRAEADIRVAVRVLENVERGRIYWRALQGERGRAEAFAYNVATIIEQTNGVTRKAISAQMRNARKERTRQESKKNEKNYRDIRKKALDILRRTPKRNVMGKLIEHAKRADLNLTWPKSRKRLTEIVGDILK